MSALPESRVTAQWAVVGKIPGQVMGFDVLEGSLARDRAIRLLRASMTASPEGDRPGTPEALPWRIFRSGAEGEPAAFAARVDMDRSGGIDATGRASHPSLLLVVDWVSASAAGLTWTSFDRAAAAAPPSQGRTVVATELSAALSLPVPVTYVEELAASVDRIGFDWAATVAASLLDAKQVVITLRPDLVPPSADERVLILDAVCSLLPYGCRTWLSAATWAGQTDHDLRLVFARRARGDQLEAELHGGPPPEPTGAARTYVQELRRLRTEKGSTAQLVKHLASLTPPLGYQQQAQALTGLREINLLEAVLEAIRAGRGDIAQVKRVLERRTGLGLDAASHGELITFLAHRAVRGSSAREQDAACEVLLRHWQVQDMSYLAADLGHQVDRLVDALTDTMWWLRLAKGAGESVPGAFADLLTSVLNYEPDASASGMSWDLWKADLLRAAEAEFGNDTAVADPVLASAPRIGMAWLRGALNKGRLDTTVVSRLVRHAGSGAGHRGGWVRCLGALVGELSATSVDKADVAAFLEADDKAWLTGLEIGHTHGVTAVLELLWLRLWAVANSVRDDGDGDRRALKEHLDRLVPPGPGLSASDAARADLLLARNGSMPRLRDLVSDRDTYAATLATVLPGFEPDSYRYVVGALLGQRPEETAWDVLTALVERRVNLRSYLLDALTERLLSQNGTDWLVLALEPGLMRELSNRRGLAWLSDVSEIRDLVYRECDAAELSAAMLQHWTQGQCPDWLLGEVEPWLRRGFPAVDDLAKALDEGMPNLGMGMRLYSEIGIGRFGGDLRVHTSAYVTAQSDRWKQVSDAVHGPTGQAAVPPSWSAQQQSPTHHQQFQHQPQELSYQQSDPYRQDPSPNHQRQQGQLHPPPYPPYPPQQPQAYLPGTSGVVPADPEGETRTVLASDERRDETESNSNRSPRRRRGQP